MKIIFLGFFAVSLLIVGGSVALLAQAQAQCVASLNIPNDPPPSGLLARSNLSCATFQIKGPAEYSGEGFYWPKFEAPPGIYTITWGSVSGYITPLSETKELKEGGQLLFLGNYNETGYPQGKGTIKVNLLNSFLPPYPHFTLKGPTTRTEELSFKWEGEMPAGTYTITYEDLDDHGAPTPETKTLERNGTITFDAAYGPPKAHVFIIDSKPSGAKVYLDGLLLGTAPIKARIPLGIKKHTIRCSLNGYEDYNDYDYRAQEPDSTTYSIGAKWTCTMVAQREQTKSSETKSSAPASVSAPEKEITPVPRESSQEIIPSPTPVSEQKSDSQASAQPLPPAPKSQRNFFFRFLEGITSFFRRLF